MLDHDKKTLSLALQGAGLHLIIVLACITILCFSKPISLPSSGAATIWLFALLLLSGFVSLLKLIVHLAIVMWQCFWFITARHSPKKRYIEIWVCVCSCIIFGVIFLYCGVTGLLDEKVIFPLSRHTEEVSLYDSPFVYWLSLIIWFSMGMLFLTHTLSHGVKILWAFNKERIQINASSKKN